MTIVKSLLKCKEKPKLSGRYINIDHVNIVQYWLYKTLKAYNDKCSYFKRKFNLPRIQATFSLYKPILTRSFKTILENSTESTDKKNYINSLYSFSNIYMNKLQALCGHIFSSLKSSASKLLNHRFLSKNVLRDDLKNRDREAETMEEEVLREMARCARISLEQLVVGVILNVLIFIYLWG